MLIRILLPCVLSLFLCSCGPLPGRSESAVNSSKVRITILQMNDVYEIDPVNGGSEGGLARVASLRDQLLREHPDTITVLAGDLLSPSALGTAPYNDGRLAGKQIVAVMNVLGLDYITFGNHEFDLKKDAFYARLRESQFQWISSNCFDKDGTPFPGVAESKIIDVHGIKIGIFAVTIAKNQADYVTYKDPFAAAAEKIAELRPKVDILIGLTHLNAEDDIKLAARFPQIDLILGGHEHENMQFRRGKNYTPICKADANARTVYIHDLWYDRNAAHRLTVTSKLARITDALPDQKQTAKVIEKWREIGYAGFRKTGFTPDNVVEHAKIVLGK